MKAATILLALVTIGLGVGLFMRHTQAIKERDTHQKEIEDLKQELQQTRTKLDDTEQISLMLRTNLSLASHELLSVSNNYLKTSSDLQRFQNQLKATTEAAKAAEEAARAELAKKEAQISALQAQGDELGKKIGGLEQAMASLNKQISDTESKLSAAEGDREFLLGELKRLQAEKAELERQFNDLALLRTQIGKLKEELSVSRRLEWIRLGIYGPSATKKAAELLLSSTNQPESRTNYDLNVELRQNGGAKVVAPTNTPPK